MTVNFVILPALLRIYRETHEDDLHDFVRDVSPDLHPQLKGYNGMLPCYYICWCLSVSPFGSFSILRLIPDLYADFPSFMPNYLANIFPVW